MAQPEATAPFKGANMLVVSTFDSAHVALRDFAEYLRAQGVTVRLSPQERSGFSSEPRSSFLGGKAVASYVVLASPGANSQLTITGQVSPTMPMTQPQTAAIIGREKEARWAAFRIMETAAVSYANVLPRKKKRLRYIMLP